jgi:ATP-binding protein involved in chromosome partitioning
MTASQPSTPNISWPAKIMLAIASGKGGVGKSTITINIALLLSQMGARVGVLDVDVYGPDVPVMTGLTRRAPVREWTLSRRGGLGATPLAPVERYGVLIASTGFLFGEEQPLAWSSDLVDVLLNQLIWSTSWGNLDYLIVDMPPGTADVTQRIIQSLPTVKAIVVVTPQDVAHLDARKLVTLLRQTGTTVLGGIENMKGFVCPCCGTDLQLFPPVTASRSIWSLGVAHLGEIPFEPPRDSAAVGLPIVLAAPQGPQSLAMRAIAKKLSEMLHHD